MELTSKRIKGKRLESRKYKLFMEIQSAWNEEEQFI